MKHANMIARISRILHAVLTYSAFAQTTKPTLPPSLSLYLSPSPSSPSKLISKRQRQRRPEATYPVLPRSPFVPPHQNTLSPFFSLLTTLLFCISLPSSLPLPLPSPPVPLQIVFFLVSQIPYPRKAIPSTQVLHELAGAHPYLYIIRAQFDFRDAVVSFVSISGVCCERKLVDLTRRLVVAVG